MKKHELKRADNICELWKDNAAIVETKKQGVFETLKTISERLAIVEVLLREIN